LATGRWWTERAGWRGRLNIVCGARGRNNRFIEGGKGERLEISGQGTFLLVIHKKNDLGGGPGAGEGYGEKIKGGFRPGADANSY